MLLSEGKVQCRYASTWLFYRNFKHSQFATHHHKLDFTVMSNRGKPDDQGLMGKVKGMFLSFLQQGLPLKVKSHFGLFYIWLISPEIERGVTWQIIKYIYLLVAYIAIFLLLMGKSKCASCLWLLVPDNWTIVCVCIAEVMLSTFVPGISSCKKAS